MQQQKVPSSDVVLCHLMSYTQQYHNYRHYA